MSRILSLVFSFLFCLSLQGFVLKENQATDDAFFENFKSDPFVGSFFEPVSKEQGALYWKELKFNHDDILERMDRFRENDWYGNPHQAKYPSLGSISPTTLRFIKTAGDIRDYFGTLQGYRILHLGAGYGGLCKILREMGGWTSYTIAQEMGTNLLCKKYLECLGIEGIEYLNLQNCGDLSRFDFLIIDAEFLTDAIDLTPFLKAIPRGIFLKRGVPEQFNASIRTLKSAGYKGLLQGDLNADENVLHILLWRPDHEFGPSQFSQSAQTLTPSSALQKGSAISNQATTHRLGDQLLTYFTTQWIAHVQGVPFLLSPFPYAEQFRLASMAPKIDKLYRFKQVKFFSGSGYEDLFTPSTLWQVPFIPYSRQEKKGFLKGKNPVKVDWDNPEFRALIRESLTPVEPVNTIIPPKDRLSVALHVRTGGAFKSDKKWHKTLPLKFAPDAFMIRALKTLLALIPDTPLYIYLFTDDLQPEKIIEKYQASLPHVDIIWDYSRDRSRTKDQLILEDLLSFQNFDCLIRPCSHFSVIGGKLGRYELEIGPTHYYLNDQNEPVCDQIELFFRPALTREEPGVLY